MEKERNELEKEECCCCGDHNHEESCDCSHEDSYEMFSIADEDGVEHDFALISELPIDEKLYWVCQEVYYDEEKNPRFDEETYTVFRVEADEDQNMTLESLDDGEFEKVSAAWEKYVEEILAEEDEEE